MIKICRIMDIHSLSASELALLIRQGELSPVEVTKAFLERIDKANDKLNAFITIDREGALKAAQEAEKTPARGPLHGVPVAIKDLSYTKGLRTTCGSLTLKDNVPDCDSISVTRIREAGAIIIGKTNTPEFGYKGVTDNRLLPPCVNPWNTERTSGGSSGGSASAVAAQLVPIAEGTDGAGSIRIPAGFCGVVGFKPSFALVPRYPIPDVWYTLSHTGPIARNVADASLLFHVLAGSSRHDPLSMDLDPQRRFPEKLKIAWSQDLGYAPVEEEIAKIAKAAAFKLEAAGHSVVSDSPELEDPEQLELNIWNTVYASRYAPLDDKTRSLLCPEMVEIIEEGMKLPTWKFSRDSIARTKLYYTLDSFLERYDLLITPTLPVEAFPATQQRPAAVNGRPIDTLFGWTPFTYPFNLTGQPAITVPAGLTAQGMPVGLQIIGARGCDELVLRTAAQLEKIAPFAPCPFADF